MSNKQSDKIINFADVREKIIISLKGRTAGFKESVSLVDGFVSQPFTMELSNTFKIGGPTIPMIMLLGNDTGQIYFFALKAILKDLGDI